MDTVKKITISGMLTALALVCSYIDNLIPVFASIPGAKLGLANIVIIAAMYAMGIWEAVLINIVRVILAGLLFGTVQSFMFSAAGALLSLTVMGLMKQLEDRLKGRLEIKLIIVSELGSLAHITGQLAVACSMFAPAVLAYYSLYMYGCAAVSGILIAIPAAVIIRLMNKNSFDMG